MLLSPATSIFNVTTSKEVNDEAGTLLEHNVLGLFWNVLDLFHITPARTSSSMTPLTFFWASLLSYENPQKCLGQSDFHYPWERLTVIRIGLSFSIVGSRYSTVTHLLRMQVMVRMTDAQNSLTKVGTVQTIE